MHVLRRSVLCASLAAGLLLAACTDAHVEPFGTASPPGPGVSPAPEDDGPPPEFAGDPPTSLEVDELAPPADPDSRAAEPGDVVMVHYTGRAWSTGEVFDSSRQRGPFGFQLGAGGVIRGWDEGVVGLRVGQQVRLTIPPDLAYGEAGVPGAIAPGETLVFDIEVIDVIPPEETTD